MLVAKHQVTYVIKSWVVNAQAQEGTPVVTIQGRAPGFVSWLLSKMGIEPTVELKLTHKTVEFSQGSLFGQTRRMIPLTQVASISHGYSKPISLLVLGLATLPFVVGLVFLVLYVLNKALTIEVGDTGAGTAGFRFKRSVIEGASIDEKAAAHIAALIDHYAKFARG